MLEVKKGWEGCIFANEAPAKWKKNVNKEYKFILWFGKFDTKCMKMHDVLMIFAQKLQIF